jgi:hypothetical protein
VFEEGGQTDTVVGHVLLLADDCDVVLSCPRVELQEFLSGRGSAAVTGLTRIHCPCPTYMKLMPTMPRPTTTTLLRVPTAMLGVVEG